MLKAGQGRDNWRKYVQGVANPEIKEQYSTH